MSGPRFYKANDHGDSISSANRRIEEMFARWELKQERLEAAREEFEAAKREAKRKSRK